MRGRPWLVALLTVGLTVLGYGDPPEPDWTVRPQVVSLIAPQPNGTQNVVWTFDHKVDHTKVQDYLTQFVQFSQAKLADARVGEDTFKRNPTPQDIFTVTEFSTKGLVDLQKGVLWLDPHLKTFAEYKTIHLYVVLPKKVDYKGYPYFENPALQVWVDAQPNLWRCLVRIRQSNLALLSVPSLMPEPQSQPAVQPTPQRPSFWGWGVMITFFVAALAGGVVYLVLRRSMRSHLRYSPIKAQHSAREPKKFLSD